ncbi:hypothetical protein PRN20_00200 [Devosia sp. ZB163]|uniref:hypothetical protein n=1 Tax=Devosia sp. ZB163 TaxID=3025938 RepID=UPI002361E871|nr:hypothetical protein [Devosia sp. ZB163]MDC9822137.1 hypothetical protein [Devosia sp. ZB163]
MNKIIALALVGATLGLAVVPTAFALDSSISKLCGPDAPAGYKAPGGFCEQVKNTQSLVEDSGEDFVVIVYHD